jgi:hypothetical protein
VGAEVSQDATLKDLSVAKTPSQCTNGQPKALEGAVVAWSTGSCARATSRRPIAAWVSKATRDDTLVWDTPRPASGGPDVARGLLL